MVYLTVFIFIKKGQEETFHEYESLVLPILNDYNGELVYRIRPTSEVFIHSEEEQPYEVHFISFKSHEDFMLYIKDDKRKSFEKLKTDSIKSTFIVEGQKI